LITRLSNVRRIVVRPTSSVLRFADAPDASAAGRELGVDFVLSGTVRRAGGRIRVSGQLLDVRANATVWAERFDEDLKGVLELEDAVAERVGNLLIPRLNGDERRRLARRGTASPAAFESYLRGRYHLYQMEPSEFAKARAYFEKAVGLDAGYAHAYVGLAEYYFALGAFAPVPPEGTYDMMREMAGRALAIDDTLGEAYAILGYSYLGGFDFERFERNLRRGIELNPHHSLARLWHSILLTYYGRYEEAVAEAARAAELNPLGAFEQSHYAWILYQARRFDEAVAAARKCVADDPRYSHGLGVLSLILRHMGQTEESLRLAARALELSGGNPWMVTNLATGYAQAGEKGRARALLRELEENPVGRYILPGRLVGVYVSLGDNERALDELERAYAVRDPLLVWITSDPGVDPLRGHARFVDIQRRIENYAKRV
jgi:tetratricopeptide (TPR) repeat protein